MIPLKPNVFLAKYLPHSPVRRFYLYVVGKKRKEARKVLIDFMGEGLSRRESRYHLRKMMEAHVRYAWQFDEYFIYAYNDINSKERREIVPEEEKDYFCKNVNPRVYNDLFKDKGDTYRHFAPYFKREVCVVKEGGDTEDTIRSFIERHDEFFIKPINMSVGTGIQKMKACGYETLKQILKDYEEGAVMEGLIQQNEAMAAVNPSSANTVRVTTFIADGKVHILHPFALFGRKGHVVNNGSQGGIICKLDAERGVVVACCDKHGRPFEVHPDSGISLIGFQVPHWDEAKSLAVELAGVLPQCRYVGWDLAYTDGGWVMVEGNSRGQFVGFQAPTRKGIRSELLALDPHCLNLD